MRRATALCAALLLCSAMALAQAGTNNNSSSQQEIKPGTGRGSEILLSPDINQQITGNVAYTEGGNPDISSYSAPATAGAVSNGAESTAAVTTAEQMTRQYIEDEVAHAGGTSSNGPLPPNAFNEGATPQNGQANAQNDQTSTQPDKQHPGSETHARTNSSQREKKTKGTAQSQMPQSDQAGRSQNGQASQEPNYKSDHNSVSNRKDYSGKTSKRSKKAEPIENGFHKPGAPVKGNTQSGQRQNQGQPSQQPPR